MTIMRMMNIVVAVVLAWALGACGGGSGSASGTSYPFVAPTLNATELSSVTYVDNASNSIGLTEQETVTAVNADGSFVVHIDNPNNNTLVVNGTTYSVLTEDETFNDTGQALSYSYTPAGGTQIDCVDAPHGVGPDFPVTVGQAWVDDFTVSCGGNAPIAYSQTGTVVDVESVSVPAGAFTALKLQSTLTWTTAAGVLRTETLTTWRDTTTGHVVKEIQDFSYSVPPAGGYPVSRTTVLLSQS